jgi:hypothetical protein
MRLGLALTFALLLSTVLATTCHSDCSSCHGPFKRNCNDCGTNMELLYDQCVCKVGYFDYQGRCDLKIDHCLQMAVVNGVPTCTQCELMRDTLVNGQCIRDNTSPYFVKFGFTWANSTTKNTDLTNFVNKGCRTLGS